MAEAQLSKTFPVKPKLKSKPRTAKQTPESEYWSSFKTQQIPNLISVPCLTFSPTPPHPFAVAHSASLSIFSSETLSITSNISSFSDVVSCASFRPMAASSLPPTSLVLSKFSTSKPDLPFVAFALTLAPFDSSNSRNLISFT
ncbi:hypothetical protein L6164_034616 [Bauhinia variegata]|uniref:Uncharacterized protein n=1 Tax=Bauhinia variegata TaxID=167791 RepID=A0ACB9KW34_BAUVA|nr:hypothetical protein L6164_034616 [Bauhinia variegata]